MFPLSCEDIDFSVEDLHAYAHLLFVGLSLKLYQGDLQEALSIGIVTTSIRLLLLP